MDRRSSSPSLTRRQALVAVAAATASPWLLDGSRSMGQGPGLMGDHRMYLLVPGAKGWAKFTQQRPDHATCSIKRDGRSTHGMLVWLSAADAKTIAQDSEVKSLHALTSDDIAQVGDAKKSGGKVAVQVGPGDWAKPPAAGTYRTRQQIADEWSKKLAHQPGLKLELLKSEPLPGNAGIFRTNAPGQILISYPGEECPAEVLRLIRNDPQVYHIQFGGPQELWHCPPCGRG